MQLGGHDVDILSTYSIEESMYHTVGAILRTWPRGVIEDSDTSEFLRVPDLLGGQRQEVFVFKDYTAWGLWTQEGWTASNCKQMVHVLAHPDGIVTCVVEDPADTELGSLLVSVREALAKGPVTVRR